MSTTQTEALNELATYAYSYPHKSSYRPLVPAVPIADAWRGEDVRQLSLYVHIPFCEMRCGFCNLFTQSQPEQTVVDEYLATLARQMTVLRQAVPQATFGQMAIGGGTPTFLSAASLARLLTGLEATFELRIGQMPSSVEVSPATATTDRLAVLRDFGVERVSLGVQSFVLEETRQFARPQHLREVHQALERIRASGFPVLNIDLMYGAAAQGRATWLASLRAALQYRPEELYLYPLYVRPETGLARQGTTATEQRTDLYLLARELLLAEGYTQASLRCFRRISAGRISSYGCQRDGMLGLGCGARSYTTRLHYATRFATTQAGIRGILKEWIALPDQQLALATHGVQLSAQEQRRRFVILGLLQAEGFSLAEFQQRFPTAKIEEIVDVSRFVECGWLQAHDDRLLLTAAGLQNSDTLAPLLYSREVRERLRSFVELRSPAEVMA